MKDDKTLYHIVAVSEGNVIGKDNSLPWPKLASDLKHFKETTLGSTIIMGRRTFESLGSRTLPGRENFVISRSATSYQIEGARFFSTWQEAVRTASGERVFLIGGSEIFRETLFDVDGILMTKIYAQYPGDTYYPEIPSYFEKKQTRLLEAKPEEPKMEIIEFINTHKESHV